MPPPPEAAPRSAGGLFAIAAGVAALALLVTLAHDIPVVANDDTFVYFTYAKNFSEGRPFAYDPRGIPSEGFTSWVYLALLVPVELLEWNPMAAAVALNLAALGLAGAAVARLYLHDRRNSRGFAAAAGLLFLTLASLHDEIRGMASFGLESLVNGFAVLWLAAEATRAATSEGPEAWRRGGRRVSLVAAISVLVRPENGAIALALALLLLAQAPRRGALLRAAVPGAALLGAWLLLKLWLFGDVLPTGFYRKVRPGAPEAFGYVASFLLGNAQRLLVAFALGLAPWLVANPTLQALRRPVLVLAIAAAVNAATFLNVNPLVGANFRFLAPLAFCLHAIPALVGAGLLQDGWRRLLLRGPLPARLAELPRAAALGAGAAALLWTGAMATREGGLVERAKREMEQHPYLAIGRELQRGLRSPEDVVLVFGDAGGLPYALGSVFVDPNGLTEPAIARLSREPDGPSKRQRFADYLLAQRPDLVVVAVGNPDDAGRVEVLGPRHGPFREPNFHFPVTLATGGFRYGCSLRAFYDLHVALHPASPQFEQAARALRQVCSGNDRYFLERGLTVVHDGHEAYFAPLWPSARTPAVPGSGAPS